MNQFSERRPRGRPKSIFASEQPKTVQALERGLVVLSELAKNSGISLTDLAIKVDMPASSVHRVLATLEKHGFAGFEENTQEWFVGVEAFRAGNAFLTRANLAEAARDAMRQLMDDTGETANLAIADSGDVVFIGQIESDNPIRAFFNPGTRGSMHASGIGKALLAEMPHTSVEKIVQKNGLPSYTDSTLTTKDALFANLDTIRQQGWSLDDEERFSGMRCVAATIHNAFGEAIAGISVSGPSVRFSDDVIAELGPKVISAAGVVTSKIGGKLPT